MPEDRSAALARRAHAYENPRPELQRHVPQGARRILDLGCSSGALGAALKERQGAEVVGIELEPAYAERARARLDRVEEADLETFFADAERVRGIGAFDALLAGDVLEHLRDPWSVLAAAVALLRPGGTAVLSLPNIRYWHTFWVLGRRGTWPRHPSGIFDATHLRFFALADARGLMEGAGLAVEDVDPQFRRHPFRPGSEVPALARRRPLAPFFAFQYVLTGRRR